MRFKALTAFSSIVLSSVALANEAQLVTQLHAICESEQLAQVRFSTDVPQTRLFVFKIGERITSAQFIQVEHEEIRATSLSVGLYKLLSRYDFYSQSEGFVLTLGNQKIIRDAAARFKSMAQEESVLLKCELF